MKVKGLILSAAMVASTLGAVNAQAGQCNDLTVLGTVLILSVTSAPTGTSVFTTGSVNGCYNRDMILNVKEDAVTYGMTGEVSPLLHQAVEAVKLSKPEMSDEAIAQSFVNIQ